MLVKDLIGLTHEIRVMALLSALNMRCSTPGRVPMLFPSVGTDWVRIHH